MSQQKTYDIGYDHVYFCLWQVTLGQAETWREAYRGAKYFARFVLKELEREDELLAKGERALVRRGLFPKEKIINTWILNVIEDCAQWRIPTPPELMQVLALRLNIPDRDTSRKENTKVQAQFSFNEIMQSSQNRSLRAISRDLDVDLATILRWRNEPKIDVFATENKNVKFELFELTDFLNWRDKIRVMRRK